MEEIFWSNGDKIKKLNAGYEKALDTLKTKAISDGDLDLIEAVVKEQKRFIGEKTVSEEKIKAEVEEIGKLQKMYTEARQKLKLKWAKDVLALAKNYDKALQKLQVSLTRNEDIAGARAIRDERKRVDTIQDVKTARAYVKKLKPQQKDVSMASEHDSEQSVSSSDLEKGLILYYPFRRNEREKVSDESGNNNDGEVNGATWHIRGKAEGGCCKFDGHDDYITVTGYKGITGNPPPAHTVSMWVKANSFARRNCLFGWGNENLWGSECLVYIHNDDSESRRQIQATIHGRPMILKDELKVNTWYHYTLVYTGMNPSTRLLECKMYLNGEEKQDINRSRIWSHAYHGDKDFVIGRDPFNPNKPEYSMNGKIDEVRVYNRALSKSEVRQLYNAEK